MNKITEIRGNIFESSCQTIVNTVNCVGVMGKGIALEFKSRFPDMFDEYARYCAEKRLRPGVLHLWTKSTPWILNFPTKNHWKYPSKIEYIEDGLAKFALTYAHKGITSIAFPELGTSSGGLRWNDVRAVMYRLFEPLPNLDIEIYHYDPVATDSLFDKLYQRVHRFGIRDYKDCLRISSKQAKLLMDAFDNSALRSMRDVQELNGIGEKSLVKLYELARSEGKSPRLITQAERQPSLPF